MALPGYWVGPQNAPTFNNTACNLTYNVDGDAVVFYIRGMSYSATEDLRIDLIRKYNGFPIAAYRDILDLTKPKKIFDPKKTIDVIQEL